jgi:phosphate transport system permease protein
VLPSAAPGIFTGTVLSFARALGETAPLLLIGGAPGFFASPDQGFVETVRGPYTALPAVIFNWSRESFREFGSLAAAAIVVLLGVLLVVNAGAILLRNRFERTW